MIFKGFFISSIKKHNKTLKNNFIVSRITFCFIWTVFLGDNFYNAFIKAIALPSMYFFFWLLWVLCPDKRKNLWRPFGTNDFLFYICQKVWCAIICVKHSLGFTFWKVVFMTVLWSYESLRAQSLLLRKNLKTERINLEDFLDIWQQAKSLIRLLNLYKSQKNSTQWSFILTLKSADKIIILRTESQDISLWRLSSKNKALIDLSSVHKYLE